MTEKKKDIPFSGPIRIPLDKESKAIQKAPAYDKARARTYNSTMPEIRKLIDTIQDKDGLTLFGTKAPSLETFLRVEQEIRSLSARDHKVSLILVDLKTQSGTAYHSSIPMCSQSTVKEKTM